MQEEPLDKHSLWIAPLLIIYNFCANLTNDIYLPSLPRLVHVFSTSSNTVQLTMTAWFAGVALPQLFFGPLSDKIGRRPLLFWGGGCFLLATALCALAPTVSMVIVARFFQGVGVCSLNVCTFGILVDLFTSRDRSKIINKISMCGTIAPLLGPILGGYVMAYFGWRANFVIIFLLACVSLLGLWFKLPESNLYLNPHALKLSNIFKNYYLLLSNVTFLKNLLPFCLFLGGLVAYLTAAPFILISQLKISSQHFGYAQLPIFSAYIVGSLYLMFLKEEQKINQLLKWGLRFVLASGFILLSTSFLFGNHVLLVVIPMTCYTFGMSVCASTLINEAMSSALFNKGPASAFLGFCMAMSCFCSSLAVGLVYNGTVFSVACLIFLIVMIANSLYFILNQTTEVGYETPK